MDCTKKVTGDWTWVGGSDRRLALFEGVYGIPDGVSYNAYLLLDEKTVLMDTVDQAVASVFFENLASVLNGRPLDYVVVQHMEPDHSATLADTLRRYPEAKVVCTAKSKELIGQFFAEDFSDRILAVKEKDKLEAGRHTLTFYTAPMVHWPEVMVTFDEEEGILFSADAFGTFGALNGTLFADQVDFMHAYLGEARRYYANIVGKYGPQVQAVLKKSAQLPIRMICPLHGFVWRKDLGVYIEKYARWSAYEPEDTCVLLAYASIYGHTKNAAEILACRLWDLGLPVRMYDVSVTPAEILVSEAFRCSHLVFASPTTNLEIFSPMEHFLRELLAHRLQNRTVALIENGSWAPTAGKLMREILSGLKGMTFVGETLSIRSSLKEKEGLYALAEAIAETVK